MMCNEYALDLSELEDHFPVTRMIDVRKWRGSFSKKLRCVPPRHFV